MHDQQEYKFRKQNFMIATLIEYVIFCYLSRTYDVFQEGEFILYRHKTLPYEVTAESLFSGGRFN